MTESIEHIERQAERIKRRRPQEHPKVLLPSENSFLMSPSNWTFRKNAMALGPGVKRTEVFSKTPCA